MTLFDAGTLASAAFFLIYNNYAVQVHGGSSLFFGCSSLSRPPPMHGFGFAAPLRLIIVTTFPTS